MRIVYLHQYFNTPHESGSTRSYEFARYLASRGHTVHVVTSARDASARFRGWRTTTADDVHIHRVHVEYSNTMAFRRRIFAFIKFALLAGIRARQLRGDVVFATSTPLTIAIPARIATALTRTPLVFEVRDLWPEVPIAMGYLSSPLARKLAFLLQDLAYNKSEHIVALSPDMKTGIERRGYPGHQISVIPNSADTSVFTASAPSAESFRAMHDWLGQRPLILYCGTLGKVNDTGYIVRLAQEARSTRPDYRFLIVGDGIERQEILRMARIAGVLETNLFLMPSRPKNTLAPIYAAATVALSTVAPIEALWANSANKVFDAFAAGVPVAINHEGWLADVIRRSGSGVVLDPHDPHLAISQLRSLVDDPDSLAAAKRAAQALGNGQFNRQRHALMLSELLESVVAGQPAAPDNSADSDE